MPDYGLGHHVLSLTLGTYSDYLYVSPITPQLFFDDANHVVLVVLGSNNLLLLLNYPHQSLPSGAVSPSIREALHHISHNHRLDRHNICLGHHLRLFACLQLLACQEVLELVNSWKMLRLRNWIRGCGCLFRVVHDTFRLQHGLRHRRPYVPDFFPIDHRPTRQAKVCHCWIGHHGLSVSLDGSALPGSKYQANLQSELWP